jgi:uncharacterized protein (DUF2141 family)
MRTLYSSLTALLLCLPALPSLAVEPTDATLRVDAQGFRNTNGAVGCVLFRQADGFPESEDKAFRVVRVPVDTDHATCEFTRVPPGTYAVAVLHDENRNRKLDKNFLGIPQEGWGVSNNVRPAISAPSFQDATFTLKAGANVVVPVKVGY